MRSPALPVVVALCALACDRAPLGPEAMSDAASADAALTVSEKLEFVELNFVPCANGGEGEGVQVNVKLHVLTSQTTSAAGGTSLRAHLQDAGSWGIGVTTGTRYRRVGTTRQNEHVAAGGFPAQFQFNDVFNFIAPGPGNNFKVKQLIHVTVTRGGVTALVEKSSAICT